MHHKAMHDLQINFKYMEPESTEQQCCSSILRPDYSRPENPLANLIYSQRFTNDQILNDCREIVLKNYDTAVHIADAAQSIPPLLSDWWEPNSKISDVSETISKIERLLMSEIDNMNAEINCFKEQNQTKALQLQEEVNKEKQLLKAKEDLKQRLAALCQSKQQMEQKLVNINLENNNCKDKIKQYHKYKLAFELQKQLKLIEINKIESSFEKDSQNKTLRRYYEELFQLIESLAIRRKQARAATDSVGEQLVQVNNQIDQYQNQIKVKQGRKEKIVSQHLELKKLNEQLALQEERRKEAEKKKADLQKIYCEEHMEKVVDEYQSLHNRLNLLLGKSFDLARRSANAIKLDDVNRLISREPSQ